MNVTASAMEFKLPPRPAGEAAMHKRKLTTSERQVSRAENAMWERIRMRDDEALFMDPVAAVVHEQPTVSDPGVWRTALQYIARTVSIDAAREVMPL